LYNRFKAVRDHSRCSEEEMETIHVENKLYWDQGLGHTDAVIAAYGRRQDRLEELRKELAQLRLA
jgi:hypothetical protein